MKENNNYAFPHKQSHEQFQYSETVHHGMTLRDYFAAKAMQSLLSSQKHISNINILARECSISETEALAKISYDFSDAMLKHREL